MPVYLLPEEPVFPTAEEAEPDGLIAIGGDLSVERLIQAYAHGIFPWFKEGGDVYWYSPDPRMVIFPGQFKSPASLNRITRSGKFQVRFNTVFEQVIRRCSDSVRPGEDGTWISHDFIDAYLSLHKKGLAHSVETFYKDELVGGLYGVSLGTAFFGESMFFAMSNASKVALDALVKFCRQNGFKFIDCQVESAHLMGFGASLLDRKDYLKLLEESLDAETILTPWTKKKNREDAKTPK